jgi:hypothetical protein
MVIYVDYKLILEAGQPGTVNIAAFDYESGVVFLSNVLLDKD